MQSTKKDPMAAKLLVTPYSLGPLSPAP